MWKFSEANKLEDLPSSGDVEIGTAVRSLIT